MALSKKFIEERRQDLLKKKEKLEKQLRELVSKDRQSTYFDADFPDYGDKEDENAAEVADYEGNLSLEEDIKFSLERINKALKKIEKGTYGICEKTGNQIEEDRLVAFPQAITCMAVKSHNKISNEE